MSELTALAPRLWRSFRKRASPEKRLTKLEGYSGLHSAKRTQLAETRSILGILPIFFRGKMFAICLSKTVMRSLLRSTRSKSPMLA